MKQTNRLLAQPFLMLFQEECQVTTTVSPAGVYDEELQRMVYSSEMSTGAGTKTQETVGTWTGDLRDNPDTDSQTSYDDD